MTIHMKVMWKTGIIAAANSVGQLSTLSGMVFVDVSLQPNVFWINIWMEKLIKSIPLRQIVYTEEFIHL